MKDKRPLIGITPGFDYSENRMFINRGYCEAMFIRGMPVLLPLTQEEKLLSEMIENFDGFLLSGDRMSMRCIGENGTSNLMEKYPLTATEWSFLLQDKR